MFQNKFKKMTQFSIVVALALQVGACAKSTAPSTRASDNANATLAPVSETDSRSVQRLLYASNVLTQVHALGDRHFLSELLLNEIQLPDSASGSVAHRLALIKGSDLLKRGELIFRSSMTSPTSSKPGAFRLNSTQASPWDELSLLTALHQLRSDIATTGEDAAQTQFETTLQSWGTQIVESSANIYQDKTQLDFKKNISNLLETKINPEKLPQLYPDSSLGQLSQALPNDLKVTAEIKKYIAHPTGGGSTVIKRIASLTFQDFTSIHDEIKQLIGIPALNKTEQNLIGGLAFHKIDAGINLAGFFIDKVLGDSQFAKTFSAVANDSIAIAKTAMNFQFAKIGADFATGNVIGGVTDLISNLSSIFGVGADPNAAVLQAIASVRQDIADMRSDMDKQFDQVDQDLSVINQKLDDQLTLLDKLTQDDQKIQASIQQLGTQVTGLTLFTESGFQTLLDDEFNTEYTDCLGSLSIAVVAPDKMTAETTSQCLNHFYQRATYDSLTAIRNGSSIPVDNSANNFSNLNSQNAQMQPAFLVNLLLSLGISVPDPEIGKYNPADWQAGTEAYLEMRMRFPNLPSTGDFETETLQELIQTGAQIQKNLQTLADPRLLSQVLAVYETAFNQEVASPSDEHLTQLSITRQLLDLLLQIGYPEQRMDDPVLALVMMDDGLSNLPTANQIEAVMANKGNLPGLQLQENLASVSILRFLNQEAMNPQSGGGPTLVDETMERLTDYLELVNPNQ